MITDTDYAILCAAHSTNPTIQRRIQILKLRYEGKTYAETAADLGVSMTTVGNVVTMYVNHGLDYCLAEHRMRAGMKLSYDEEEKILARLADAAAAREIHSLTAFVPVFREARGRAHPAVSPVSPGEAGSVSPGTTAQVNPVNRGEVSPGTSTPVGTAYIRQMLHRHGWQRHVENGVYWWGPSAGQTAPTRQSKRIYVSDTDYETLRGLSSPHPDVQRRIEVLRLRHDGHSLEEIAEVLKISTAAVSKHLREYRDKGLTEILRNRRQGYRQWRCLSVTQLGRPERW